MNKKTIIILGSIFIAILVCCCLVLAGLMLWNYSQTTEDFSFENVLGERITSTPTPYIIVKITGEAQENEGENLPHQTTGEYANDVGLMLVDCSDKIGAFSDIATSINDNVNLIMDPDFITQVNTSVDDIKNACTNIGQDDNVPPAYKQVNEELLLADEAMYGFGENIHKGINEMDMEAIGQALYDLASASSHYENANELLSE
jgi:hypothetical protein